MIRTNVLVLVGAALLGGAAFAQGQEGNTQQQSAKGVELLYQHASRAQAEAEALAQQHAERSRERQVQVEVLRRLLDEQAHALQSPAFWQGQHSVAPLYGSTGHADFDSDGRLDLTLSGPNSWGQRYGTLAYSPDGKSLFAQDEAGTLVFDAVTGKFVSRYAKPLRRSQAARTFEGVYLEGYGVVYSGSLPLLPVIHDPHSGRDVFLDKQNCAKCHHDPFEDATESVQKTPTQPASRWEQIRRELTGETSNDKNEAQGEPQVNQPLQESPGTSSAEAAARSLADSLLKVLAENGRHCTQLTDDERVTLAVTLHAPTAEVSSTNAAATLFNAVSQKEAAGSDAGSSAEQPPDQADSAAPSASESSAPAPEKPGGNETKVDEAAAIKKALTFLGEVTVAEGGSASTYRDLELLGDLHLKQGKTDSALQAYGDAVAALQEAAQVTINENVSEEQANKMLQEAQDEIIQIYAKLAHAQALLGRHAEARETMAKVAGGAARLRIRIGDQLMNLTVRDDLLKLTLDARRIAARLPVKLIVTAPKKLLVEVGEGKIGFEEFKKQATIELQGLDRAIPLGEEFKSAQ